VAAAIPQFRGDRTAPWAGRRERTNGDRSLTSDSYRDPNGAALSMSGSSFVVATGALLLKHLRLPDTTEPQERDPLPMGR